MQRLFATFPTAGPGVALLFLRLSVAAAVLIAQPWPSPSLAVGLVRICLAVLLTIGWLTPILAAMCCFGHFVLLITDPGRLATLVFMLDAAALMLMGPGAYSIDARLFGRRVLVAPRS